MEVIELENTLHYDPFEDEKQNKQTFPQLAEELEPLQVVGVHYIGAEILLHRGDEMERGHVVAQSHDSSGNIMDRAHINPKLDTMMYQVEFAGGKVKKLSTNESMYAQCDADGIEYLLLDVLADYHKDSKVISFLDQQTSIWYRPVASKTTAGLRIRCQWKDISAS